MIYVGDANDPATILQDSGDFLGTYCASSPDDQVADWIKGNPPPPSDLPGGSERTRRRWFRCTTSWLRSIGRRRPEYLERLGQIAGALLANRDDNRLIPPVDPVEAFRGRVMPAWGGKTADRDNQWNTDPVIAGLFIYPMAAFARRVADNPALYAQYKADAIRFITATMETYEAFRRPASSTSTTATRRHTSSSHWVRGSTTMHR